MSRNVVNNNDLRDYIFVTEYVGVIKEQLGITLSEQAIIKAAIGEGVKIGKVDNRTTVERIAFEASFDEIINKASSKRENITKKRRIGSLRANLVRRAALQYCTDNVSNPGLLTSLVQLANQEAENTKERVDGALAGITSFTEDSMRQELEKTRNYETERREAFIRDERSRFVSSSPPPKSPPNQGGSSSSKGSGSASS